MAKSNRKKTSPSKRGSRKGKGSRGKKIGILFLVVIALIVVLEASSFLKGQFNLPKDYPVQAVLTFNGETQSCGPFQAWDITSGLDFIALSDQGNKRILFFDTQGHFTKEATEKQAGPPEFKEISRVTSDPKGNVYVMDTWNGLIRGFDQNARVVAKIDLSSKGFYGPRGVAWDNGDFVIADTGRHRLVKVSADGTLLGAWGDRGSGKGFFDNPSAVAVDSNGNFYVVDQDNHRVQCLNAEGRYVREYGVREVPTAVALDEKRNLVYIASTDGKFIKVFSLDGKYVGDFKDVARKETGLEGINALHVLDNGDVIASRRNEIIVYRPLPSATNPSRS